MTTTTGGEKRKATFMTLDDDEDDAMDTYLKASSSTSNDIVPMDSYMNQPPPNMSYEDEDLDALIAQSIEHEQTISMDAYFSDKQQHNLPQDDENDFESLMADSFAREKAQSLQDQNDLFAGERLEYPTGSPSRSFLTAMDGMELDDVDDDLFNDLAAAHQHNLATNRDIDPYFVRHSTPPPLIKRINKRKQPEKDYTQMPTTGAFVSAATSTGKSLYFPKKLKTIAPGKEGEYLRDIAAKKSTGQLLDKPIWQMQKELEASNKATLERIQRLFFFLFFFCYTYILDLKNLYIILEKRKCKTQKRSQKREESKRKHPAHCG
jgi:hypothetical protein